MQYRVMPKSDDELSVLGFGCMRFPLTKDNNIDEPEAMKMMQHALDNGINYFDTAWPYHGEQSEPLVGRFLSNGNRAKVKLATKLPSWLIKTREDMDIYLDKQLERLQTDYIDYYLLHALNKGFWKNLTELGVFDFLEKAKAAGKIRHIGFSFHDKYPIFEEIVDGYEWDFCQIQLNFFDTSYQAGLKGMHIAASKGIGIIAMEPLRGGKLTGKVPADVQTIWDKSEFKRTTADRSLRWVWNKSEVQLLLSGMSTMEQVEQNLVTADSCSIGELTPNEAKLYEEARKVYIERMPVGCTSCGYCMPCPHGVNIPGSLGLYNNANMFENKEQSRKEYLMFIREESRADKCINCGECVPKCPQQIEIPKRLAEVAEYFI